MNKYVISDIHGANQALEQVLSNCNFDYENDLLIVNGDICDCNPETFEVLETLLKINNLVIILGNHDVKLINWLKTGKIADNWLNIGGSLTIDSYKGKNSTKVSDHLKLLSNIKNYHIEDNILFVHAGINDKRLVSKNNKRTLHSNRTFWQKAIKYEKQKLKFKIREKSKSPILTEIFIGHSPVNDHGKHLYQPVRRSNVYNTDTGSGNGGVLTIMNIHSKKFWSSRKTSKIYKSIY